MQSMTGYGRGLVCEDGREMTVEVKSVNHRFLDVSFRLARPIAFLDDAVRTGVAERLARGHVDVFVNYVNHREDARRVHVDMQLAKAYWQAAGELSEALGVKNDLPLSDYMNMPDVLTVEASEEDQDAVRALFMRALNLALDDLTAMRKREGNSLRGDMMKKLDAIDGLRAVKRIHRNGMTGERFKRQRRNKTACVLRHHNKNVDAPLLQQAQQLACLINRNAPGHAEDNARFFHLT